MDGDHVAASLHHHPGGHGRVDATRDEGHDPSLDAYGEAARRWHHATVDQYPFPRHLDADGDLRSFREVDLAPHGPRYGLRRQAIYLGRDVGECLVRSPRSYAVRDIGAYAGVFCLAHTLGHDGIDIALHFSSRAE